MDNPTIKILLIEDSSLQTKMIAEMLHQIKTAPFELLQAASLAEGLEKMDAQPVDVILLDLTLPDSMGLETFQKVHRRNSEIPIVVLTSSNDDQMAVKAVQEGAQDYLIKGQVNDFLLGRALRYAIERQQMQAKLSVMALTDELTGLYNRRAFFTFARQHYQVMKRTGSGFILMVADLDGLKAVNDTYGHQEGDRALLAIARTLKETFRAEDIIARFGGDEFAVLALQAEPRDEERVLARVAEILAAETAKGERPYPLALSMGTAYCDPLSPLGIDELLALADQRMYQHKRGKRT